LSRAISAACASACFFQPQSWSSEGGVND
jgi:hypothetical protein